MWRVREVNVPVAIVISIGTVMAIITGSIHLSVGSTMGLASLGDRVTVLEEGRIARTFSREELTEEQVMLAATG